MWVTLYIKHTKMIVMIKNAEVSLKVVIFQTPVIDIFDLPHRQRAGD